MNNQEVFDRESVQKEWYQRYYSKSGKYRNDLLRNPEVLFQTLAMEAAVVRAFRSIPIDLKSAKVLDVGCGGGGTLFQLIRLGFEIPNFTGIDIQEERLTQARKIYPHVNFIKGDATRMDFEDNSFDLVFESGMFATLPDDVVRQEIAQEMVRVCKPSGYFVLVDWWTPKPGDKNYKALTRKELNKLFLIGKYTELLSIHRGALVPPIGRFLSKYASFAYFLVAKCFPFLVGQVVYVLKKRIISEKTDKKYFFYIKKTDCAIFYKNNLLLSSDLHIKVWTPKLLSVAPKELISLPFIAWWLFHWFRVFKTPNYKIYLVYTKNKKLVHYVVILPAHYRFPFMKDKDLSIGPIFTDVGYRGKGISKQIINLILNENSPEAVQTTYWYIVRAENKQSMNLIEKLGFQKIGEGRKIENKCSRLFSYFNFSKKFL